VAEPVHPQSAIELDHVVGLPPTVAIGSPVLFEPTLPARDQCPPELWERIVVRHDERWREWHGPIGDAVRNAVAEGRVSRDPTTGVITDIEESA
jgi:hypothetical protein